MNQERDKAMTLLKRWAIQGTPVGFSCEHGAGYLTGDGFVNPLWLANGELYLNGRDACAEGYSTVNLGNLADCSLERNGNRVTVKATSGLTLQIRRDSHSRTPANPYEHFNGNLSGLTQALKKLRTIAA